MTVRPSLPFPVVLFRSINLTNNNLEGAFPPDLTLPNLKSVLCFGLGVTFRCQVVIPWAGLSRTLILRNNPNVNGTLDDILLYLNLLDRFCVVSVSRPHGSPCVCSAFSTMLDIHNCAFEGPLPGVLSPVLQ